MKYISIINFQIFMIILNGRCNDIAKEIDL